MHNNSFASQIKRFRKSRGLDRHEFAAIIENNYLTVAKWETGKANPTNDELYVLCEKFDIPTEAFGLEPREIPEVEVIIEEAPKEAPKAKKKAEAPKPVVVEEAPKSEPRVIKIAAPKEEKKQLPEITITCNEELTAPSVKVESAPIVEEEPVEAAPQELEPEKAELVESEAVAEAEEAEAVPVAVPTSAEAQAYEEKKARYEKYVKISSYRFASVKIRRIFAWLFDFVTAFILCGAIAVAAGIVLLGGYLGKSFEFASTVYGVIIGFAALFGLSFEFRDWIFAGRSLGKRIFGLKVVDERTGKKAFAWQRLWRTLFLVEPFDFFLLIFSGRTVGDRITGAVVVSNRKWKKPVEPKLDDAGEPIYDIPERKRKSHWFITFVIVLLCFAVAAASVFFSFVVNEKAIDELKESEQYQFAVDYVVETADDVAEEDIVYLFSLSHADEDREIYTMHAFIANGKLSTVCVYEVDEGVWAICAEHTIIN